MTSDRASRRGGPAGGQPSEQPEDGPRKICTESAFRFLECGVLGPLSVIPHPSLDL